VTPLVFLHGFTGRAEAWGEVMALLPRGRPSIALDLPGHGEPADLGEVTGAPADILSRFLSRVERSLDDAGARRAVWVGYSMGGRIALQAAVERPERVAALVLEGASPGILGEEDRRARLASDRALADRIEAEGVEAFAAYWEKLPLLALSRQAAREAAAPRRRSHRPETLAAALRALSPGALPWVDLRRLSTPSLWIAGVGDEKYRRVAEESSRLAPRGEALLVSGAGHDTHSEDPAAFADALLGFLERLEAT